MGVRGSGRTLQSAIPNPSVFGPHPNPLPKGEGTVNHRFSRRPLPAPALLILPAGLLERLRSLRREAGFALAVDLLQNPIDLRR